MGLIIFSVGLWVGIIVTYLMFVKPLDIKYESLKEEFHQQIKIGFYNEELKEKE
jgi:type II secretory pathway component PulM